MTPSAPRIVVRLQGACLISLHGWDEAAKAMLLLALLTVIWGVSWPIMKIGLDEIGVWNFRAAGYAISGFSLFAAIKLQGRSAGDARLRDLGGDVHRQTELLAKLAGLDGGRDAAELDQLE